MAENEQKLSDQVLSEVEILEKLNVEQPTLDRLRREKSFPYIRLNVKSRVYLASDVLDWLKGHKTST
jgi:predicted DNA-binding transcriptional regulator AlpA